jgi:hypothetical protein
MRLADKSWNSYMFNFIKYFIVSWFIVNFLNFLNLKFFFVVLKFNFPFFPLFLSTLFAVIFALFLTYYSFQIQKILQLKKTDRIFTFKSSINLFIKELTLFEKTMYLFLNFAILILLETLSATVSIYANKLFGIGFSLFIYSFLLFLSAKFLLSVFKSQKFRAYKMGIDL